MQAKNKTKDKLKDHVVCFRITPAICTKVQEQLDAKPIVKCDSTNKFARKLMLDWLAGRLTYKVATDRDTDSEVLAEIQNLSI